MQSDKNSLSDTLLPHQLRTVQSALTFTKDYIASGDSFHEGLIVQTVGSGMMMSFTTYLKEVYKQLDIRATQVIILADRLDTVYELNTRLSVYVPNKLCFVPKTVVELTGLLSKPVQGVILTTKQKLSQFKDSFSYNQPTLVITYLLKAPVIDIEHIFPVSCILYFSSFRYKENPKKGSLPIIAQYSISEAISQGDSIPFKIEHHRNFSGMMPNPLYHPDFQNVNPWTELAKNVITHFTERGTKGKALIVVRDLKSADLLYHKMSEYSSDFTQDVVKVVTTSRNPEQHRKQLEEFRDFDSPFKIAITINSWLTGVDNPFLDTIYLVRNLSKTTLFQVMANLSRPTQGRLEKLIVDYMDNDFDAAIEEQERPEILFDLISMNTKL